MEAVVVFAYACVLAINADPGSFVSSMRHKLKIQNRELAELPAGEQVTVSQGIAAHRSGERIEDTLKRADDALYRAKDGGPNLVVC